MGANFARKGARRDSEPYRRTLRQRSGCRTGCQGNAPFHRDIVHRGAGDESCVALRALSEACQFYVQTDDPAIRRSIRSALMQPCGELGHRHRLSDVRRRQGYARSCRLARLSTIPAHAGLFPSFARWHRHRRSGRAARHVCSCGLVPEDFLAHREKEKVDRQPVRLTNCSVQDMLHGLAPSMRRHALG